MNTFSSPRVSRPAKQTTMKSYPPLFLALLCTALLGLAPGRLAQAADGKPPTQLTYQGFLTDANGVPLGNTAPLNKTIIFRIYDAATGGNLKWSAQQVVTLDKGHFSVLLGEGSQFGTEPFNADLTSVFSGSSDVSDRHLQLTVDNVNVAPRLRFLPAPYAVHARTATQLVDPLTGNSSLAINGGNLTAVGSITSGSITASGAITASGNLSAANITANGNLSASGITASGAVVGGSFSGNGANLTSLNASQITSGTIANGRTTSTDANTANTIVARDASGNFSAGTITATSVSGNGTIPLGGIIMWSGALTAIPAGWALCDGSTVNGRTTPNLKDRFVVGAGGTYAAGSTGGNSSLSLTSGNLPSFSINYSDIFFANATNAVINNQTVISQPGITTVDVPAKVGSNSGTDADNVGFAMSRTATNTGTATAFSIIPPYYALAFIMRVQ